MRQNHRRIYSLNTHTQKTHAFCGHHGKIEMTCGFIRLHAILQGSSRFRWDRFTFFCHLKKNIGQNLEPDSVHQLVNALAVCCAVCWCICVQCGGVLMDIKIIESVSPARPGHKRDPYKTAYNTHPDCTNKTQQHKKHNTHHAITRSLLRIIE